MAAVEFGINFMGRFPSEIGLGEAARQMLDALKLRGIALCERELDAIDLPYRVNLLSTNFPDVLRLTPQQQRNLTTGRYTIAQYYWELARLKTAFQPSLTIADELWAASRFIQTILSRETDTPLHLIPPPIHITPPTEIRRAAFGLPEQRTLYFFNFNVMSNYARKNPEAVIEAFRRAFGAAHADSPVLVIKSQYLEHYPPLYQHLLHRVEAIGGILINRVISSAEMTELIACADVYVSLHRAEGFGLGMAEAMLLGKPVIATDYSGNTDYMTPENSYPVGFSLRPINAEDHRFQPDFETVYEVGQDWAEPDIDQAAAWMTHLYEQPAAGMEKGAQAARDIQQQYNSAVISGLMMERFAKIDLAALPNVLPAPQTHSTTPEAPWKRWGQRLYRTAIPTPIRLGLRQLRHTDERRVPVLEPTSIRYQAAEALARAYGYATMVVLGSDAPEEIAAVAQRFETLVVDKLEPLKALDGSFNIWGQDWETPLPRAMLQQSVVVANLACAPSQTPLLRHLNAAVETGACVLVSAPLDAALTLATFSDNLRAAGLPVWFQGHADDLYVAVLGYPEAPFAPAPPEYRVVAVMPVYNEADIILQTLRHLIAQGVEVYVLDNHSTDATAELARSLLGQGVTGVETYPPEATPYYEWEALLRRVETLSETLDADWIMLHDSDEIRESFMPEQTLRDTLYQIDRGGYNAVNHSVLNFAPTDDSFTASDDPQAHFQHAEPVTRRDYSVQVKAWKKGRIDLTASGGHAAAFAGRRIYPFHFLMRHYPVRTQAQGERKIFQERAARIKPGEQARGWHSHLSDFTPQQSFIRNSQDLRRVDATFYEHSLLERLTGVGLYPLDDARPRTVFVTSTKRRLPTS